MITEGLIESGATVFVVARDVNTTNSFAQQLNSKYQSISGGKCVALGGYDLSKVILTKEQLKI